MANQRRVRDTKTDDEAVDIADAVIAITSDTSWVRVGETWVDTSRIISVSPLSSIWDEEQGKEGIPEPEGGVAIHVESPHPDTQFVQEADESVDEIMERIIEATTES